MKTFRQQFVECKKEGLCDGRIRQAITADLMPLCPSKARKMLEKIRNGLTHLEFIRCGRFGGVCRSKNPKCITLRNGTRHD